MSNATKILKLAKAEVGYHEGRSASGSWNNRTKFAPAVPGLEWADGQAWCAVFVSYLALKAGVGDLYPRTASCDVGMAWFKDRGQFSEYPAVGAQVFFGVPGDSTHTGIVDSYDADYIYTIEGNTNTSGSREGDGVYTKKRVRRDRRVLGYGYPKFTDGIKNADPARKGENPKPPVKAGPVAVVVAAGGAVAAVTASPTPPPPKSAPAPVVKPAAPAKPSIVLSTPSSCKISILKGEPKFQGRCTITIKKGK